jgi:hypothetical protein
VRLDENLTAAVCIAGGDVRPPFPVRLMARFPLLQRIPGWLIGNGVRPEHVRR